MTKRPKKSASASKHSERDVKSNRDGTRTDTDSTVGSSRRVTPTSERIIRETSVKRRRAMTVLANRQEVIADTITNVARGETGYDDLAKWFQERLIRPGDQ